MFKVGWLGLLTHLSQPSLTPCHPAHKRKYSELVKDPLM